MADKSSQLGSDEEMEAANGWRNPKHRPRGSPLQIGEGSRSRTAGLKSRGSDLGIDEGSSWHGPKSRASCLQIDDGSSRRTSGFKSRGSPLHIDGKADDMADENGWRTIARPRQPPLKINTSSHLHESAGDVAKQTDKQIILFFLKTNV